MYFLTFNHYQKRLWLSQISIQLFTERNNESATCDSLFNENATDHCSCTDWICDLRKTINKTPQLISANS